MVGIYLWVSAIVFTILTAGTVVPPHKDATVAAVSAALMASCAALGWVAIFAR